MVILLIFIPIRTVYSPETITQEATTVLQDVPQIEKIESEEDYEWLAVNKKEEGTLLDLFNYGEELSFDLVNLEENTGNFKVEVAFYDGETNQLREKQNSEKPIKGKSAEHFTFIHDSVVGQEITTKTKITAPIKKVVSERIVTEDVEGKQIVDITLDMPKTVNWLFGYEQRWGLKIH